MRRAVERSAAGVCADAGITLAALSRIENGRVVYTRRKTALGLAQALGVSIEVLCGDKTNKELLIDAFDKLPEKVKQQAVKMVQELARQAKESNL